MDEQTFNSKILHAEVMRDIDNRPDYQASRYLVIDFGTSQSPKSTRQRDCHCAPAALRPCRFATPSQARRRLRSTPTNGSTALGCSLQQGLWRFARRPCLTAWRLPGTTGLGLRPSMAGSVSHRLFAKCCTRRRLTTDKSRRSEMDKSAEITLRHSFNR